MKKFLFWLLLVITIVSSIFYLAASATPFVDTVNFWPMIFLALAFPYLTCWLLLLIISWVFVRKKVSLILVAILLFGYQNIHSTFAFHLAPSSSTVKENGSLRIMTWNVRGFDNPSIYLNSVKSTRSKMFRYIKQTDPDILCLQEFNEILADGVASSTTELVDCGYRYFYRTDELVHSFGKGYNRSGSAIFSKIPIVDSGKVLLGDPSHPEHIAFIDVLHQNKRLRIFTTHFKSFNLFFHPSESYNDVAFHYDTTILTRTSIFEKLKIFGQDHAIEAKIAKAELLKSPYPYIFTADMNSVPTSFQYHYMAKGLTDVFLANGFGLGTTIDHLPATLRIDFILTDKHWIIKNYQKKVLHLSDHFPQYVDLQWKQ